MLSSLVGASGHLFENMTAKQLKFVSGSSAGLEKAGNLPEEWALALELLRALRQRSLYRLNGNEETNRSRRQPTTSFFRPARRATDGENGMISTLYSPLPHLITSWPGSTPGLPGRETRVYQSTVYTRNAHPIVIRTLARAYNRDTDRISDVGNPWAW